MASIDWAAVEKLSSAAADGYQNNETVALADTAMREAVKGAVDAGFQPVGSTTLTGAWRCCSLGGGLPGPCAASQQEAPA